jgi:hypothetical protein
VVDNGTTVRKNIPEENSFLLSENPILPHASTRDWSRGRVTKEGVKTTPCLTPKPVHIFLGSFNFLKAKPCRTTDGAYLFAYFVNVYCYCIVFMECHPFVFVVKYCTAIVVVFVGNTEFCKFTKVANFYFTIENAHKVSIRISTI